VEATTPDESQTGAASVVRILKSMDATDEPRFEPPHDLWQRIATSLAALQVSGTRANRTAEAPSVSIEDDGAGTVIAYRIDADDVVIATGGDWAAFARANGAPELTGPLPRTCTLWDSFADPDIREVWRLVIGHARSHGRAITVPFRCDAANARRWFEMTVTPQSDGHVDFRSIVTFEMSREPVTLLDIGAPRDDAALPIDVCSWCANAHDGDDWLDVESFMQASRLLEQPLLPSISYGICPTCREQMSIDLLASHTFVD